MKKLVIPLFLSTSFFAQAEIAVIVHPSNANALDAAAISRIFLGKAKSFPDGGQAVPINQQESASTTSNFNGKVLNKSASQLKAYWSKLVFTGKGTPPKEVTGDKDVLKLIAANPSLIGYVAADTVNNSVKVVAKI